MSHAWIFDVLDDLKQYSQKNDLQILAAEIDEARRVARQEIAAHGSRPMPALDIRASRLEELKGRPAPSRSIV